MNKYIVMVVKDNGNLGYNKTYKWNSEEEFSEALKTGNCLPKLNDIILECYVVDNLVDIGNTFEVTLEKLKLILNI